MSEAGTEAVEALLAQAQRLGLVPSYRLGTVLAASGVSGVMVTLDNDTAPSRCFNFAGPLAAGDRVFTCAIRPQGIYVFGSAPSSAANRVVSSVNKAGPAVNDSTTSATYVSLTDSSSVSIVKNRSDTQLSVDLRVSCFLTGATNSKPSFAVQVNSTDYEIVASLINPVSTHEFMAGLRLISGIPAGTYTVQARWLRVSGTGTLNRNSDDWFGLTVYETF